MVREATLFMRSRPWWEVSMIKNSLALSLISLAYGNVFIHFFERLLYFSINNTNFKCFLMFRKTLLISNKYSSLSRRRDPHRATQASVTMQLYFVPPPGHWERFSCINNSLSIIVKIFFRFFFFFSWQIDFLFLLHINSSRSTRVKRLYV